MNRVPSSALVGIIVALLLVTIPCGLTAGQPAPGGRPGVLEPIIELPTGGGPGTITVLPEVDGGVSRGPQALAVDPDGTVYIADSAGRQILICAGQSVITLDVPWIQYARDLAVTGGQIFILDVTDRIWVLDRTGSLINEVPLPRGMTHLNVHRLVPATDAPGELLLWCTNYIQFTLSGLPSSVDPALWDKAGLEFSGVGPAAAQSGLNSPRPAGTRSIALADQNRLELLDHRRQPLQAVNPVGGGVGSARLIHLDGKGQMYVLVEELGAPNPGVQVELSLRACSPSVCTGAVRLPIEDMAAIPWQPVAVAGRHVYVLVPGAERVAVYRVIPGPGYASRLTHDPSESVPGDEFTINANIYGKFKGYPIPQSRAGTRSRAMDMANYYWTWRAKYNYLSNGTPRSSTGAVACSQLVGLSDGTGVYGIPYCWGGWDSPWTYSDNWQWTSFGDALGKYPTYGPLVGNTTSAAGWIYGSAGIDCSGFAAAAADAYYIGVVGSDRCYKPGVGNLASDGKTVTNVVSPPSTPQTTNYAYYSGMQPMSFFTKTGHVLYYNYRLLDGSGLATLESTTDGSPQAAKTYARTWSHLKAYSCKSWWDKVTGDDFDVAYTTKTSRTAIKGAQVYYKFQASGSSHTITVTASSGDPDLYVYNRSYGYINKSTNWGSDSLTISTVSGQWYYIKVHAWTDCGWSINW